MKTWQRILILGMLSVSVPAAAWRPTLCDPPIVDETGIPSVWIEDENLWVTIRWSENLVPSAGVESFLARIQVLDREETLVASREVAMDGGRVLSYQVTEETAFIAERGYGYVIRLLDEHDRALAEDFPVLVSFCPAGSGCQYTVVEGVGTDAVAMGEELFGILEELEAGGSRDLLNDALDRRPDLDFEIYWVADQLSRLHGDPGSTSCVCAWNTAFSKQPSVRDSLIQEGGNPLELPNPDWELIGHRGPGAYGYLAGQALAGQKQELSLIGRAEAGLHLRCRAILDWQIASWAGRPVHIPTLSPCHRDCEDASIQVSAGARSQTLANAWSTSQDGARGRAFATSAFFLDQQLIPEATTTAGVEVDRFPGDAAQEMLDDSPSRVSEYWVLSRRDAAVSYVAETYLELCLAAAGPVTTCDENVLRSEDDRGPWAFGCAATTSRALLVGEATCARESRGQVTLFQTDLSHTENGLLIVPWNP